MDEIETSKDKENIKKTHIKDIELIDAALFDKTLSQIEVTLKNLGENVNLDQPQNIDKKKNVKTINLIEEHTIDNTHLRMEELHDFSSVSKIKEKRLFGFYTYLALIIGFIFAIYEILNVTKNKIIFNYPILEPYIEYFYEVIEILAYIVMNIVSFIKNLF